MLQVQQYLADHTLDQLQAALGIRAAFHPSLPLVILNYNQLESEKLHPIVRECRGLVLEKDTWNLVARSFSRFYNWGEVQDEMKLFDFSNCCVQTKEDGSLVLVYNYRGEWRVNTRGAFAQDSMQFQSITWQEGIIRAMGISDLKELDNVLDSKICYVCEFCSPWNKVVRRYQQPILFLLSAFNGENELSVEGCDSLMCQLFKRPQRFHFSSIEEVQDFLADQASKDPTYEGVVMRDRHNHRWKVKSATYLGLHRLKGENNLFNPKHLLPFILAGDTDELLTYFEEAKPAVECYQQQVDEMLQQVVALWESAKDEPTQKGFALKVKDHFLSGVLFTARKEGVCPKKVLRQSPDSILKNLKLYS